MLIAALRQGNYASCLDDWANVQAGGSTTHDQAVVPFWLCGSAASAVSLTPRGSANSFLR
jgi:hypothetical protein